MIYTITMNPALDYVVDLPEFKTNQVNRVVEEHIFYGGKGINVAVVLKELGIKSDFVHVSNGLTRINVKIHSQQETELNGLGPVVSNEDIDCLYEKLKQLTSDDVLVISGSVPSSMSLSIYDQILKRIDTNKVKVVIDATGDLLKRTLKYKPFLIKPNNHELGAIFNVKLENREDVVPYARKMQEKGARNVLVSMAGQGAVLLDETGEVYMLPAPKGELVNAVGAGDSMVAGFLAGWLTKEDYEYAFCMGVSAGSASAFSENLATKEEVEEVYRHVKQSVIYR